MSPRQLVGVNPFAGPSPSYHPVRGYPYRAEAIPKPQVIPNDNAHGCGSGAKHTTVNFKAAYQDGYAKGFEEGAKAGKDKLLEKE